MAYIDDERRRRAGVKLTPKLEDWMARAMMAQAEGLPIPPKPTDTGDDGMQRLTPAYTDPRSQAIAQTPAMIRPAHSMLDRLFRPGRADAANQMNREYKENALKGQIANQSSGADAALKELEFRAKSGKDPEALKGLKKYYEVEALRRGSSGNNMQDFINMAKGDGSIPDGSVGSAKPKGAAVGSGAGVPLGNPYMNMAKADAEKAFKNTSKELDEYIARYESIVAGEGRARSGRLENLMGMFSSQDSVEATPNEIKDAAERVMRGKESKIKLQKQFEEAHGLSLSNVGTLPLTGADMGGPTEYNPNR